LEAGALYSGTETSLKEWFSNWLLKQHINKCKVVLSSSSSSLSAFGINIISAHYYSIDDIELKYVQHVNDLGINFYVKLTFSLQK